MSKICKLDDCDRVVYARMLCRKHYIRDRNGVGKGRWRSDNIVNKGVVCRFDDCNEPAHCRQVCKYHYLIVWRAENPEKVAAAEARRVRPYRAGKVDFVKVERLVAEMAVEREKAKAEWEAVKPRCKVDGCESPVRARRMCINHYNAEKKLAETHGESWSVEPDPEEFWLFVKKELKIG